ncbi:MAG: class I SAM-dependent methyltransferase [Actinobacteria bacterium]|nr:class I SAM-dependent methyltransferase [Actinomycetota bacterium]MBU1942667.1 class I SAM-dependent methyltransferase [Actinomycetota bacterium]MBU2685989.1 class I SAM-dependent methyltransferase [Actinomycetota bacterium]
MDVDLRKANELFHDVESMQYDGKWGIAYDLENAGRVRGKYEKLLGGEFPHVDRMLEVGCGTGYVGLNLCLYQGLIGELDVCDISQGMVDACLGNAAELGLEVRGRRSELENLDYPEGEFDMVIGHAILHHVPDIERGLTEIFRVLKPGGAFMLAGEPTVVGDIMGRFARGGADRLVRLYARLGGRLGGSRARLRPEPGGLDEHGREIARYEHVVDIHTFWPPRVARVARSVGFEDVRCEGEEFLSSFVGWMTRTVENNLSDENISMRWRFGAYHTYLRLHRVDDLIYPVLPAFLFYNMLLYGRKPEE